MCAASAPDPSPGTRDYAAADIGELSSRLAAGSLSALDLIGLVRSRVADVDVGGPSIRSVIELAADAEAQADSSDEERRAGHRRGPLHGVPVLVKDNIDTTDMLTTAGSLALTETRPRADAAVVTRLRDAGAIVVGKANLSEWANFRSTGSSSGWSARGGLTVNPHALERSAGGSSSGSAAAVAAGLVPLALGTETDGSILCPAALCGVVGLKPTVGLTSRAGVIPISHTQDSVGPITRTVRDAAVALSALTGRDYVAALASGVDGLRVGVARTTSWGTHADIDALAERAVGALAASGATVVDDASLPSAEELTEQEDEMVVLLYEFKAGIERYLAERSDAYPQSLADLIEFNRRHADVELAHFGQELFERAVETPGLDHPDYRRALERSRRRGREDGIDAALRSHTVDVLVAPAYPPAWPVDLAGGDPDDIPAASSAPAVAGYPALTVPIGLVDGLPVGLAVFGTTDSETALLRAGAAVERALGGAPEPAYRPPQS